MENKLSYGVVGAGYWGKKLLTSLSRAKLNVAGFYDKSDVEIVSVKKFPSLYKLMEECDVVLIATPAETHYEIAKTCLSAYKHVFCEKPLTLSKEDAADLCQIANKNKLTLGVDNTFVFSSEIQFIKSMLSINKFGKIKSIHMQRTNKSPILSCGCFYDLSSHDISILTYLLDKYPKYVNAFGILENKIPVEGNVIYNYGRNSVEDDILFVTSYVSWIYPNKVRSLEIVTSNGILSTDFNNEVIFKSNDSMYNETFIMPNIDSPLVNELISFNQSIINKTRFVNSGVFGYDIVRILEKIQESAFCEGAEGKI